jgi:CelD/BcsL family acetyltransferase involved in cellulose biosynthesis
MRTGYDMSDTSWRQLPMEQATSPGHLAEWDESSRLYATSWFQTSRWVKAWWEATGRPDTLVSFGDPEGRAAKAVIPLSHVKESLHRSIRLAPSIWRLSGTGVGAADHAGWLGDEAAAAASVRRMIEITGGQVLLPNLDPRLAPAVRAVGARPVATSEVLAVPDLASRGSGSAKFEKNLRYYRRRAERAGVSLEFVSPMDFNPRHIDHLACLHEARMTVSDEDSALSAANLRLQELMAGAVIDGEGPCAILARQSGQVVGILYGFVWRSTFAYYQTGWDPGLKELSIGTVLIDEALAVAERIGCTRFDFLRGSDPYKYRFGAKEDLETSWVLGTSLRAHALVGLFRGKQAAKQWNSQLRSRLDAAKPASAGAVEEG